MYVYVCAYVYMHANNYSLSVVAWSPSVLGSFCIAEQVGTEDYVSQQTLELPMCGIPLDCLKSCHLV